MKKTGPTYANMRYGGWSSNGRAASIDIVLMRELAVRHLLPAIGITAPAPSQLLEDLLSCCRLIRVHRYQVLQYPGDWRDGYLYWFEWATAHAYYDEGFDDKQPVELLRPDRFFVEAESVFYREERYAYLQALEDGLALRIAYPSLRALMRKHAGFHDVMERLTAAQDMMQRDAEIYRCLPEPERIERFLDRFGPVAHRLTLDVQLLHMQVGQDTFRNYMRRNRRPYTSLRLHKIAMNAPGEVCDDA